MITPKSLFYLDSPYLGGESDYGKGMFDRDQFPKMAEQLAGIKGAFVLSINDTPATQSWFSAFHIEEVALTYTVAKGEGCEAKELIISNREVRGGLL